MKTFVLSQHAQTNVKLPQGYLSGVCVCVCVCACGCADGSDIMQRKFQSVNPFKVSLSADRVCVSLTQERDEILNSV